MKTNVSGQKTDIQSSSSVMAFSVKKLRLSISYNFRRSKPPDYISLIRISRSEIVLEVLYSARLKLGYFKHVMCVPLHDYIIVYKLLYK